MTYKNLKISKLIYGYKNLKISYTYKNFQNFMINGAIVKFANFMTYKNFYFTTYKKQNFKRHIWIQKLKFHDLEMNLIISKFHDFIDRFYK